MAEYIKRVDALKAATLAELDVDFVIEAIRHIPAADVRPVVRGRWLKRDDNPPLIECKCSVCEFADYGTKIDEYWFKRNFCPICGADMREVTPDG